jgi:hypothetical protein
MATPRLDPTRSQRGKCGRSRGMADSLFRPGRGRSGFGAWDADGRLLATHTRREVLEEWYGGMRIGRLDDEKL